MTLSGLLSASNKAPRHRSNTSSEKAVSTQTHLGPRGCYPDGRSIGRGASGQFGGSGRGRDAYVEGDRLRVRIVVAGVPLEREADGCKAVAFGFLASRSATAVDVQGGDAIVPVSGLIVVEQLDPQQAHEKIVL